jgi:glycosyltransferase involved in cell wall biosynthesis
MDLKVSVIIPVYNAEQYIEEACLSALQQEEVAEVILVEDGSTDNSFDICRQLANKHPRVKLFRHEGNVNKGPSDSRNLGIRQAQYEYIAFLDADDYYFSDRFKTTAQVFLNNPQAGGVYECAVQMPKIKKYTITKIISPRFLLHYLLRGTYGHFHTNAVTLRKACFEKVGYFNPELMLHQDTEMWLRLAHSCTLLPGSIDKEVCVVRIHENNRWTKFTYETQLKALISFQEWVHGKKISIYNLFLLKRKIAKLKGLKNKSSWIFILVKDYLLSLTGK